MNKEDYIKKWLEGTLEGEEKRTFEQTAEYKSLEKLSRSLMSFRAPEYDINAEYEQLQFIRYSTVKPGKVVTMNWLSPLLKIAAAFVLMAGGYFYFLYDPLTIVETLAAEKTELRLPDSSFVALNAFSKLSFKEKKWKQNREVELVGEAFFKVARGSRFEVKTSSGIIGVLGTAFNVKDRKDYFEVTCYEGSVEVRSEQQKVKLLPKQMFRVASGVIARDSIVTDDTPPWQLNESSFKSVSFRYVIQELERQYNVSISTRNVDTDQLFTGTFSHSDLSLALKSITIPLNLTYQVVGDKKIVLTGELK